jgi:hypothetical protein
MDVRKAKPRHLSRVFCESNARIEASIVQEGGQHNFILVLQTGRAGERGDRDPRSQQPSVGLPVIAESIPDSDCSWTFA